MCVYYIGELNDVDAVLPSVSCKSSSDNEASLNP